MYGFVFCTWFFVLPENFWFCGSRPFVSSQSILYSMDLQKAVSAKMLKIKIFSKMGSMCQCPTAKESINAKTSPNSFYSPPKIEPRVSPHGYSL